MYVIVCSGGNNEPQRTPPWIFLCKLHDLHKSEWSLTFLSKAHDLVDNRDLLMQST